MPTKMVVSREGAESWLMSVILIEHADRQIPAIISYVDGEEYYGQQAKHQLIRNGKNTVAFARDFLGQE